MNAYTRLLLALLASSAAASITPLSAAPANASPHGYRVRSVEQSGSAIIEIGSSAFNVRNLLGEPQKKLNANTWVYERYRAVQRPSENDDCCTLIITLAGGRVAQMKLVNPSGVSVIAASLRPPAETGGRLASK